MNKLKFVCLLAFAAFGAGMLFIDNRFMPIVESYSTGPPPSHSGAPGEGTCNECHFANPGPGIITITAPANYVPGETYQIFVQHSTTDMARMRWGFQLTALNDANSAAAGTFTDTTPFTQQDFGNLRFYIEHTETGTFPGTTGGAQWSFNWTAPSTSVGSVTFYAAGNQANNDNTFDGDQIYTTTFVTQPAAGSATPTDTPTATPTASSSSIAGRVTYVNATSPARYVSNVLISGAGSPSVSTTTAAPGANAGIYSLTGFGAGSYTVTPSKVGGFNGITSFDAARIAQHAAGIPPLLNANQLVVADASGNGQVSSFDAAQIAQWVVSGTGGHTGEWKFQPANRSYPSVNGVITGEDYSAFLIGEVSGNWSNTGARAADFGPLQGKRMQWPEGSMPTATEDEGMSVDLPRLAAAAADKEIVVPVSVRGAVRAGIISYEFDLRYDPSVIEPQTSGIDVAGTASRGLFVVADANEPGLLKVAVYGPLPISNDGVLLNLRFHPVGTSSAVSPLAWERIVFNEGSPRVAATNGEIELF